MASAMARSRGGRVKNGPLLGPYDNQPIESVGAQLLSEGAPITRDSGASALRYGGNSHPRNN